MEKYTNTPNNTEMKKFIILEGLKQEITPNMIKEAMILFKTKPKFKLNSICLKETRIQVATINVYEIKVAIAAPTIPIDGINIILKTMFNKAAKIWMYKLNFVFFTRCVILIII